MTAYFSFRTPHCYWATEKIWSRALSEYFNRPLLHLEHEDINCICVHSKYLDFKDNIFVDTIVNILMRLLLRLRNRFNLEIRRTQKLL